MRNINQLIICATLVLRLTWGIGDNQITKPFAFCKFFFIHLNTMKVCTKISVQTVCIHKLIHILSTLRQNLSTVVYSGGLIPYIVQLMKMKKKKIVGRLEYYFKTQMDFLKNEYKKKKNVYHFQNQTLKKN